MPTKVFVGLSKKKGLPDYGSIGANCQVELELDGQILQDDPDRFHQHVRRAYAACRSSVEEELSNQASNPPNEQPSYSAGDRANGSHNRNGRRRTATDSQVRAINAIAGRHRIDLAPFLDRFAVRRIDELTVTDASALIDELKAQPEGGRG